MADKINSPKICIIGAGFSGLGVGIQLRKQLGLETFTLFDENEEVGGTWFVNTYPGCACDVPSHLYSYSFEPNPNWSAAYSSQWEILQYLKGVAKKYDMYEKIKFRHKVLRAVWDEKIEKWRVLVRNISNQKDLELIFDIIISGIGGLRVPHTPEEFLGFKGPRIHSAEWDSFVSLENKTVAIIGSGASAVQIIPNIVSKVKKLMVYQRHPAWVVPRLQFEFPSWLKWTFGMIPGAQYLYRSSIFLSQEMAFPAFQAGSWANKLGQKLGNYHLQKQLGHDEKLLEKCRPNYELGCKRITPSNEYYPALSLPHVQVIRDKITKVEDHSIFTEDGTENKVDVLILATGFKVQDFFSPLEFIGKGGVNLLDLWKKEGPSAYLNLSTSIAPNCFFMLGPNSGLGHNSVIFTLECQLNWMVKVIGEMMRRDSRVVQVKESAEKEFMQQMLEDLKGTVWSAFDCGSWYADHRGVITALSPYSLISYWNKTKQVDFDHFAFH